MDIKALARAEKEYVIDLRRHFHQFPEDSGNEHRTAEKIMQELERLNISHSLIAKTGVEALIPGGRSGKTVALRADMDALRIFEKTGVPYQSKTPGMMHACGHDAHMAMLLGAAKILSQVKKDIKGQIKLVFQPAEESDTPGEGAAALMKEGILKGVDAIFALHVMSGIPCGRISAEAGPRMAAVDSFTIKISGKSGHGAMPHECIDALICGSAMAMNIQTIISREVNPMDAAVITIGKFNSGNGYNIIPGEALLEGTARYFSGDVGKIIRNSLERIVQSTAAAFGAAAELNYLCLNGPVVNDAECTAIAAAAAEKIGGNGTLITVEKTTAGEDFGEYLKEVPGAFVLLGAGKPDNSYPHHHELFDFDESALEMGTALYAQIAMDYLNR